MKIINQSAKILNITHNPVSLIERCGRVCYKSEDKILEDSAEKFVKGLIKRKHDSVLEHAGATFLLVTDRGISHEIVRHRLASYSQESTRYCKYGDEITIIDQIGIKKDTVFYSLWKSSCESAEREYHHLLSAGCSPEWARAVLPTCLKTEIVVTANFRQWRHMIGVRLLENSGRAHPNIRELFGMILDEFMKTDAAMIFSDLDKSLEV